MAPAREAPATSEERKTVTVFFADRVGFTAEPERLDPEDVRTLLDAFHERVDRAARLL
jgi:class 3 adenylate cyclase